MVFFLVALTVGSIVLKILVFKSLWAWFAVPALGVEPLTFLMAFGLSLLVSVMFGRLGEQKSRQTEEIMAEFIQTIIVLLLAWVLGFLTFLLL